MVAEDVEEAQETRRYVQGAIEGRVPDGLEGRGWGSGGVGSGVLQDLASIGTEGGEGQEG